MRIPVDVSRFADEFQFLSVSPVAVFENGQRVEGRQATNGDGMPLWSVQTLVLRTGRRAEIEIVKVPAPAMPDIRPTTSILFDGLVAISWQNNGRSGVSFAAAAVSEA